MKQLLKPAIMIILFATASFSACGDDSKSGGGASPDTTAPGVPVISGIISGTYNTSQTFTVTGETGATIEYSIDNGTAWNTYTEPVTISDEGVYYITARQTDAAGNMSGSSDVITVTIDLTAADAPVISGITSGTYNTSQTFTISGEAGAEISYTIDGGATWLIYTDSVTLDSDGSYNISARQTDIAGNESAQSTVITVIIDTTADAPLISGIASGSYNTNQTFSVTGETGAEIYYTTDGGTTWLDYTGAVTLDAEGTYNISARQTDVIGNESAQSTVITVIIDTTAPADAPVISGITDGITYNTSKTFTVSGETGITIEYSVDNGTTWNTYTGPVTISDNGDYSITARQIDAAGNESPYAAVITVTLSMVKMQSAIADSTSLALTWTDPSSGSADIDINWTDGTNSGNDSVTAGTETYTITGLTVTTEYTITLAAAGSTALFSLSTASTSTTYSFIYTVTELAAVSLTGNYILMADLDLNVAPYNTDTGWTPIAPDTDASTSTFQGTAYSGIFNGNNHVISNLYINDSTGDFKGLFGYTMDAQISNLGLESVDVKGHQYVAGLVAQKRNTQMTNCRVTGTVTGDYVTAGLVATNYYTSTITNCYVDAEVTGGAYTGGLIGYNHTSTISNCYASGSVTGAYYLGGLIGWNESCSVLYCYATGAVTTTETLKGGLVGSDSSGTYTSCFYDTETTGMSAANQNYGTPKTTAEMKTADTFTGASPAWDFTNVWGIDSTINNGYPYLLDNHQ